MAKIEDFNRINEPRVGKVIAMLGHIENSAASNRVHELDIARLLTPVREKMAELVDPIAEDMLPIRADTPAEEKARRDTAEREASPPIARELENLGHLTTQQLVDRMIACGAELAARRK